MTSTQLPSQPSSAAEQPAAAPPVASTSAVGRVEVVGESSSASAYPPSATALLMAENPSLSRSAAKKLLREQAWNAGKAERRAKEREKTKAKAAEKRKLIDEGVIQRPPKKIKQAQKVTYGARVVVDLGFDDLMIDKEIKSMSSQLAYCYAANRAAPSPVPLLFTSYNKRLRDKLEGQSGQAHKAWRGVEWWEEDYTRLWKGKGTETAAEATPAGTVPAEPATDATHPDATAVTTTASSATVADPVLIGALAGQPRASCPQSKVVYLTGDSPNVLSTLDEDTTYILGGIVDHNRYKNLCLDKATADGVAHAQLPIGAFLPEMKTRRVLTVNQVFEIIVEWVAGRAEGGEAAWRRAFGKVIPLRKMDENHRTNKKVGEAGEEYVAEEGEEEEGDDGGMEAAAAAEAGEQAAEAADGKDRDAQVKAAAPAA